MSVYLATVAPGLTFAHWGSDGGDLIAAASTLGVPHPTGYPTYTLLARLALLFPIRALAYRTNVLSAVFAAGAVAATTHIIDHLLPQSRHRPLISLSAALSLAFAPLFWSQAVITEVYSLLALFAALITWLLLRWRSGLRNGPLWLAAFLFGLGMGNHVTLIFVLPAAAALLCRDTARWSKAKVLVPAIAFFVLGISVYSYIPLAASRGSPVNWGAATTWKRFFWVVAARQYQGFAFGLPAGMIPGRLGEWAGLLGKQFGWWGLLIALTGVWIGWRTERRFSLFALLWGLLVIVYAFFYNTGDSEIYLLPLVMLLSVGWALGADALIALVALDRASLRKLVLAVIAILPLLSMGLGWKRVDVHHDQSAELYIQKVLSGLGPDSLVLVRQDRATFALWYAVHAEQRRSDVAIVSPPLLSYIWYREEIRRTYPSLVLDEPAASVVTPDDLLREFVTANYLRLPIYATDPKDSWYDWSETEPVGDAPLFRLHLKTLWRPEP